MSYELLKISTHQISCVVIAPSHVLYVVKSIFSSIIKLWHIMVCLYGLLYRLQKKSNVYNIGKRFLNQRKLCEDHRRNTVLKYSYLFFQLQMFVL